MNNKFDDDTTKKNEINDEVVEEEKKESGKIELTEEEKTRLKKEIDETKLDIEELYDEVNKLIDEVSDKYDVDRNNVKVVPVTPPKMPIFVIILTCLFGIIITAILIIGLSGLIPWAEWVKMPYLIYFALFFATSEQILKVCSLPLMPKKTKNVYLFIGLKALPFVLTMTICGFLPVFLKFKSAYLYVLLCALVYSIRKFFVSFLLEKEMKRLFNRKTKNKKEEK